MQTNRSISICKNAAARLGGITRYFSGNKNTASTYSFSKNTTALLCAVIWHNTIFFQSNASTIGIDTAASFRAVVRDGTSIYFNICDAEDSSAISFGLVIGDKTTVHFDGSVYTATCIWRTVVEDVAAVHEKSNISLMSRIGSGCIHAYIRITCNCAAIHDEMTISHICQGMSLTWVYVDAGTFTTGNNTAVHGKCST